MIERVKEFVRRRAHTRSLAVWETAARDAQEADLSKLRELRHQAKQVRKRVDQVTCAV